MKRNVIITFILIILSSIISQSISGTGNEFDYNYTEPYQFNTEFFLKKLTYSYPLLWTEEWINHNNGLRISEGSLSSTELILDRELKLQGELVEDILFFNLNYRDYRNQDFTVEYFRYQMMSLVYKNLFFLVFGETAYDKTQIDFGAGISWRKDDKNYLSVKLLRKKFLYNMKAEPGSDYVSNDKKPKVLIIDSKFKRNKLQFRLYLNLTNVSALTTELQVDNPSGSETYEENIKESMNYGKLLIIRECKFNWLGKIAWSVDYQSHFFIYNLGEINESFIPGNRITPIDSYKFIRPEIFTGIHSVHKLEKLKRLTVQNSIYYGISNYTWKEYTYPTNNNTYKKEEVAFNTSFNYRFNKWFHLIFDYYFLYSHIEQDFPKPDVKNFNFFDSENTFTIAPYFSLEKGRLSIHVNYDLDDNTFDGGNIRFQLLI